MKKLNAISVSILLLGGGLFLSASCNNAGNNRNQNDSLSVHVDGMKDSINNMSDDFKSTWNRKMDELDDRIDRWQDKVNSFTGKKKEQAEVKLDSMKAQKERLKDRINHSADHAKSNWKEFKQGVSNSYDSLSKSIDRALND